ncbi:3-oxoacid CoA-transferase subunit A [Piscinibacter sakaiensis]|uniref:3-oxoadipate CoA-transferase, subunit A n=1 Tax=Piscinibacter sakaiensis TaxID=1547922 RepID=A0A0K8P3F5_PISS1|nr:3-oxoacid CoA-transferase subunit A [Piscinibacter sakaiensis]GAP36730.1 3-oxoadipate CoA-transferase, subunit A [Piscinibacter sakaiensis]
MIDKTAATLADALGPVRDGATVLIGGFGTAGVPEELIDALRQQGARELTLVNNNAGNGDTGLAALLASGAVRKMVCSFPRTADSWVFDDLYRRGRIELELVPQGTLAERLRAAGAGIGAFFCPTGYGTPLAEGKETRLIAGRGHVLELPLHGDLALVKAERGDRWGNLTYRKAARNFGPVMAAAARHTVATVHELAELGGIDPEHVVTPGLYVDRVVRIDRVATRAGGFRQERAA